MNFGEKGKPRQSQHNALYHVYHVPLSLKRSPDRERERLDSCLLARLPARVRVCVFVFGCVSVACVCVCVRVGVLCCAYGLHIHAQSRIVKLYVENCWKAFYLSVLDGKLAFVHL